MSDLVLCRISEIEKLVTRVETKLKAEQVGYDVIILHYAFSGVCAIRS